MLSTNLFLEQHNLLPNLLPAYQRNHSTATAILKVVSGILLAADRGHVALLGLLDMSAAFDTVDHDILSTVYEKLSKSVDLYYRG